MKGNQLGLNDLFSHPANFFSLGFGSGLAPWAPGTFGTLAAIPIYLVLSRQSTGIYLVVTALIVLVGFWLCDVTARNLGVHDHASIVWDEIAGMLITMITVPTDWVWLVFGFFLFRFFDIVKPWPIKWIDQHIHGGVGIMLDDILAGLMSLLVLQVFVYIHALNS